MTITEYTKGSIKIHRGQNEQENHLTYFERIRKPICFYVSISFALITLVMILNIQTLVFIVFKTYNCDIFILKIFVPIEINKVINQAAHLERRYKCLQHLQAWILRQTLPAVYKVIRLHRKNQCGRFDAR